MKDKNGKEAIIGYPCIVDIDKGEIIEKKLGQVTGIIEDDTIATVLVLDEGADHVYEIKCTSSQLEMR